MSNMDDNKDQSMEEILQSIKRIIAEDDDTPVKAVPVQESTEAKVTGSDVLELHDLVEEGEIPDPVAKEPEIPAAHDILQSIDAELAKKPEPAAAAPIPPLPPVEESRDVLAGIDSLLTSETVKASSSALMNLKSQAQKPVALPKASHGENAIAFRSGTTLEELVVEALTPELKAWLNAHLPEIVERMVAAEIRKITGS